AIDAALGGADWADRRNLDPPAAKLVDAQHAAARRDRLRYFSRRVLCRPGVVDAGADVRRHRRAGRRIETSVAAGRGTFERRPIAPRISVLLRRTDPPRSVPGIRAGNPRRL